MIGPRMAKKWPRVGQMLAKTHRRWSNDLGCRPEKGTEDARPAVYHWGIHSLDDDATDESEILDNLSTEARTIAERFVRRNVLGDNISRYIPKM